MKEPKTCLNPACKAQYIPRSITQKYCCPRCNSIMQNEIALAKRKHPEKPESETNPNGNFRHRDYSGNIIMDYIFATMTINS